jgi:hypothetical protein
MNNWVIGWRLRAINQLLIRMINHHLLIINTAAKGAKKQKPPARRQMALS